MAAELRVVIDVNVAISAALLPYSIPRQAFDAAAARGRLLLSEAMIIELDDVFRRPKFNKYVTEEKRLEFLAALVRDPELVAITEKVVACRDPKDDKYLELGICGRATHIVTGDTDLLALNPFRDIAILSPKAFVAAK